ncbi:MAG: RsmE family RNA methyltransferase [Leptospira sp.]|nr:RsmE family RNA methyltransferase [Leptospira sp.]
MNWVVLTSQDKVDGKFIQIKGPSQIHVKNILHKTLGETLKVILPDQKKGIYRILQISDESIDLEELTLENITKTQHLQNTEIIFSLPRPQTGKKILFLCGCYGVGKLTFIFPYHKNKEYLTSPLYNGKEMEEIYLGMSQSGNPYSTEINYIESFPKFLNEFPFKNAYVLHPNQKQIQSFKEDISISWEKEIFPKFIFGPESGFLEKEINEFESLGAKIVGLGNVILRTEHAFHALLHQTNTWLETDST